MTVRYDEAMHHLCKGKQYGCSGPLYENITWLEPDEEMPTREELEAVWAEIEDKVTNMQINENRMFEYPSVQELTVALWEALVENGDLTSDKIVDIQARREAVKTTYPKG